MIIHSSWGAGLGFEPGTDLQYVARRKIKKTALYFFLDPMKDLFLHFLGHIIFPGPVSGSGPKNPTEFGSKSETLMRLVQCTYITILII